MTAGVEDGRSSTVAALREQLERLRLLHEAAVALAPAVPSGPHAKAQLLSSIVSRAVHALGAISGRLVVADDESWRDVLPAAQEAGAGQGHIAVRHTGQVARERLRPEGDVLHVLTSGERVVIEDVEREARFGPFPGAIRRGVGAFAVVPLRGAGGVLGALVVDFAARGGPGADTLDVLELFAAHASAALERVRLLSLERRHADSLSARAAAEEATRRLGLLADVSAALSSSLDYQATLHRIAELAVPAIADWCIVDVVEPAATAVVAGRGRITRVATAAADAAKAALLRELRERYPPDWDSPQPAARVLREGRPELIREVTPDALAAHTRGAEHAALMRALGVRSHLAVPLKVRGRVLGAISFGMAESGRRYGEQDLRLAVDVAERAALAVENARLYREAQEQAETHVALNAELRRAAEARDAAVRALEAERSRLRELFLQVPAIVCVFRGAEHRVALANAAFFGAFGLRDLTDLPVRRAFPEPQHRPFVELLDRVYASGEPYVARGVTLLPTASGATAFDVVVRPTRAEDGRVDGLFLYAAP